VGDFKSGGKLLLSGNGMDKLVMEFCIFHGRFGSVSISSLIS